MIKSRKLFLAAAVFALVFAAACRYMLHVPNETAQTSGVHAYVWKQGNRYYSYKTSVKSVINLQGTKLSSDVSISAALNVKIFSADGNTAEIGLYSGPVAVVNGGIRDSSLEYVYSIPVLIKADTDGRFKEMLFPSNTSERQRAVLRGFYAPLEKIIRTGSYEEEQSDSAGVYTASYAHGVMKKLRYVKLNPHDGAPVSAGAVINSSEYRFAPSGTDSWLDYVTGGESVSYKTQDGESVVDSDITVSLRGIDGNPEDTRDFFGGLSFNDAAAVFAKGIRIYEQPKPAVKRTPEKTASDTGIEVYLKGLGGEGDRQASLNMREFLLKEPQQMALIPEMIRNGAVNDRQAAELINILGMIGIEDAQRTLLYITDDASQSDNNRLRAVISFSSLKQPMLNEVKDLFFGRLAGIESGGDGPIGLYTASVLVLGTVSRNLSEDYPLEAEELAGSLAARLDSGSVIQQKYLLKSIGNTHNDSFAGLISGYVSSSDPEIRQAAVESLKFMNDGESEKVLKVQFANETNNSIKYSIVKSLDERDISTATFDSVIAEAPSEKDIDVRRGIIEMIDSRIREHPEAKDILERMLRTETSGVNIRKIIKAAGRLD